MARRVKSNKKRKYAGNRFFGGGNAKNRRGKGNRGGVGRAGYHKHKWLQTIKRGEISKRTRGEHGFYHTGGHARQITLAQLERALLNGKFQQKDGFFEVNLPNAKILSNGSVSQKLSVKARAFSAKAKEKIEAAGGKIQAPE
ncbi:TPA: 50S ribosomal protein L15 [Candidatus Micrarchaeota archaeon]|nr:50S ribosomal protein L15P [uncultured archaeon]HIH20526.1 50S ribosomal protein L15 [Candidatus Micrarchaeota archaeon]